MRRAFTIIELIFVIVILGILAAVAIPKLSATREDAEISALAMNIMNGVQEVASFTTSRGDVNESMALMSNSFSELESRGEAVLTDYNATIRFGNIANCVSVGIINTVDNQILQISSGDASGDQKCLALQQLVAIENHPIKLRGSSVKQ